MQKGVTLIELLLVVLLIPLVGMSLVHLSALTDALYRRTTANQRVAQEIETALAFLSKDTFSATAVQVYLGGVAVGFGVTGDRVELRLDDNNDFPPNPANDDRIRYQRSGTAIVRDYMIVPPGTTWVSQTVGTGVLNNATGFTVVQTTDQTLQSRNIIRTTLRANVGGQTVQREQVLTSRSFRGAP